MDPDARGRLRVGHTLHRSLKSGAIGLSAADRCAWRFAPTCGGQAPRHREKAQIKSGYLDVLWRSLTCDPCLETNCHPVLRRALYTRRAWVLGHWLTECW